MYLTAEALGSILSTTKQSSNNKTNLSLPPLTEDLSPFQDSGLTQLPVCTEGRLGFSSLLSLWSLSVSLLRLLLSSLC